MTDLYVNVLTGDIQFAGKELTLISGIECFKQQLQLRFLCKRGEIFYYPEYGTDLHLYAGKSLSSARQEEIVREVVSTCTQDPRVEQVDAVQSTLEDGVLTVTTQIVALGQSVGVQVVVGDDVEVSVT